MALIGLDRNNWQSQTEKAYQHLKDGIVNLTLKPGEPLLETELADHLGMSRTPVREAIQRLKSEGLAETLYRKGVFVKGLTSDDIQYIYETAEGLEGMCAYLFTHRADQDALLELERCVFQLEQALEREDLPGWIEADNGFHRILHRHCGNRHLQDIVERIDVQIQRVRVMTSKVIGNHIESTGEHQATYKAIRAGNAELARSLTQQHWARVRQQSVRII